MKNVKLLFAYIISVLLIGSYFFVLYISTKPEVSKEYRLFYIEHDLKFNPVENGLKAKLGKNLYFDGNKDEDEIFWGTGSEWLCPGTWNNEAFDGRACSGSALNKVYFSDVPSGDRRVSIKITDTDSEKIKVCLDNGWECTTEIISDGETSFTIPDTAIDNELLCLSIIPLKDNDQGKIYVEYIRMD